MLDMEEFDIVLDIIFSQRRKIHVKYKKESKNFFGMFLEFYRNIFKDNIKISGHLSWHFTIRKYLLARFGLLVLYNED